MKNKFVSLKEFSSIYRLKGDEIFVSMFFKKDAVRVIRQLDESGMSIEEPLVDINIGDEFKMQRIYDHNYYEALCCGYIPLEREIKPYLWHFCNLHVSELEIKNKE